jgi:HNH endonuclease
MKISEQLRRQIMINADYHCEYCKTSAKITGTPLLIDPVFPRSLGGQDDESNLAAACYRCSLLKSAKTQGIDPETGQLISLFHPRTQRWNDHFASIDGGRKISGTTAIGRVTVIALRLNNDNLVAARSAWISVGWHPPSINI